LLAIYVVFGPNRSNEQELDVPQIQEFEIESLTTEFAEIQQFDELL